MQRHQILASSCARATSAEEAQYRIASPIEDRRATAVVALDPPARTIVDASRHRHSARVRFMTCEGANVHASSADGNGHLAGHPATHAVATGDPDGPARPLADAVAGADLVVMVATSPAAGAAAATIGHWCAERKIMTAGLAVGPHEGADGTAAALRPYARMLLVTEDAGDLDEILTALRA